MPSTGWRPAARPAGGAGSSWRTRSARENFIARRQQPRDPRHGRRLQRRRELDAEMIRLIEADGRSGIFLTVLGFGTGNLKDAKMEQLADKGNGNYAYIDTFREAQKVFVQEIGGDAVHHRQGREDPGRVQPGQGAGLPADRLREPDAGQGRLQRRQEGRRRDRRGPHGDGPVRDRTRRAQRRWRWWTTASSTSMSHCARGAPGTSEMLTVRLRYKEPAGTTSKLITSAVADRNSAASSDDMRFASAVAAFAMLLRDSENKGSVTFDQVITMARGRGGPTRRDIAVSSSGWSRPPGRCAGRRAGTNRVAIRLAGWPRESGEKYWAGA